MGLPSCLHLCRLYSGKYSVAYNFGHACYLEFSLRFFPVPAFHGTTFLYYILWLVKKLAPSLQPIRCKVKTYCNLVARVFPLFSLVTCILLVFLLVCCVLCICRYWLLRQAIGRRGDLVLSTQVYNQLIQITYFYSFFVGEHYRYYAFLGSNNWYCDHHYPGPGSWAVCGLCLARCTYIYDSSWNTIP